MTELMSNRKPAATADLVSREHYAASTGCPNEARGIRGVIKFGYVNLDLIFLENCLKVAAARLPKTSDLAKELGLLAPVLSLRSVRANRPGIHFADFLVLCFWRRYAAKSS